jgi:O-methyltransferase involved in polyketide biosynthesis
VTGADWARDVDIDRPSAARMYDYYLGGSHHFAADRQAAEQVVKAIPNVRQIAVANRAFLRDAVRHLLKLGVRQFLDVGSGIPTVGNVHEVAQAVDPQARVVYVDLDPVAVIHAEQLLAGNDRAAAIAADLRHPDAILSHRLLRETLDLTQPVALLLVSVLHFLPDTDAYPAVARLREALPAGSGLVISHAAAEGLARHSSDAAATVYQRSTAPGGAVRTREEIERFFDGYNLLSPGLVWVSQWQPGHLADVGEHPEHIALLAAVARKPEQETR